LKSLKNIITNYVYFVVIAISLCSLQSLSWFFLFSPQSAPQLWIPILTYWSLYRKPQESVIMIYLLSFIVASQSASHIGMVLLLQISIYLFAYALKSRFYQPGSIFFMLACAATSFSSPIIYFILSYLFEPKPIAYFFFFDWILSALLTTLIALPLHIFFVFIDDKTNMILPTETGRQFG
jgi:hypothetical protein